MTFPEINKSTKQYWTEEDFTKLQEAQNIQDVFSIAKDVLSRMPDSLAQVCGPITSGGKGSIGENLKYLDEIIDELQKQGVHIFDQMPFEETFQRIAYSKTSTEDHDDILTEFYEPIFRSGKINTLYFVPDWESSRGAQWEYERAKRLGMKIIVL
ncbi:MAG: DUF4406 domain-containing protein [Candidatus Paceibacterota bacterium]|jgi:hypothetical protein